MATSFSLNDFILKPSAKESEREPVVAKSNKSNEPQAATSESSLAPNAGGVLCTLPQGQMVPVSGSRDIALIPEKEQVLDSSEIFSTEAMEKILLSMKVKPAHVQIAMRRAQQTKESLAQIMRDFGFLSGEGVAQAVSRQTNFKYFSSEEVERIRSSDLAGLAITEFKRYVPVGRRANGTLLIAVPDSSVVNDAMNAFHAEHSTEIVVASEHTIQQVYRKFFANTAALFDQVVAEYEYQSNISRRKEEDDSTLGLVRSIYFSLLRHACYSGASDLYLYCSEHVGIVRLKINGVGTIFRTISMPLYTRLLTKMVQDNTKPEELRIRPKEAVIEFSEQDKKEYFDIASRFGFRLELTQSRGINSAVIRILDKNSAATDLSKLPLDDDTRKALNRISRTATGFFLVTGPTGSGKTTSLYALLKDIDAVERSVQSIENPIEYKHGLWQQFELRKDATDEGAEYNEWLKALLRNAPDVILVGEVRDKGVANICMDAANTGHLVFATLHTNSAVLALARLKALEIDPAMLGATLLGILAQRLVQTLCPECSVPDLSSYTAETLSDAGSYLGDIAITPKKAGKGCDFCGFTGFKGRQMVYELLEMTNAVKVAVERGAAPSEVGALGMPPDKTMWACGLRLVAQGVTSLTELERVANRTE